MEVPGLGRDQRRPRHVLKPNERVDLVRPASGEGPLGLVHGRHVLCMTPALQVHAPVRRQALQRVGGHEVGRVDQAQRMRQLHDGNELDLQNIPKQLWIDLRLVVLDRLPEQTPQEVGPELAPVVEHGRSHRGRRGKRVEIIVARIRRCLQSEALRDTRIDSWSLALGVLLSQGVEERERIDPLITVLEQFGLAAPVHLARSRDQSVFAGTPNRPSEFSEPACPVVDFLHVSAPSEPRQASRPESKAWVSNTSRPYHGHSDGRMARGVSGTRFRRPRIQACPRQVPLIHWNPFQNGGRNEGNARRRIRKGIVINIL